MSETENGPQIDPDIVRLIEADAVLEISDDDLEKVFWGMHPRHAFVKALPIGARLLDIGANTGGLHFWLDYLGPHRKDISLYGVDLQRGQFAEAYAGWNVVNLDERSPSFPGVAFDAFLATHLIEHLKDPGKLFDYMATSSSSNAAVYLEWPAPKTKAFISSSVLRQRGFNIQTFNFFDDKTHIDAPQLQHVSDMLADRGFTTIAMGEIDLGAIAAEHLVRGRYADNLAWRQMGLWCAVGCNRGKFPGGGGVRADNM